jgi:hypothetical protein
MIYLEKRVSHNNNSDEIITVASLSQAALSHISFLSFDLKIFKIS